MTSLNCTSDIIYVTQGKKLDFTSCTPGVRVGVVIVSAQEMGKREKLFTLTLTLTGVMLTISYSFPHSTRAQARSLTKKRAVLNKVSVPAILAAMLTFFDRIVPMMNVFNAAITLHKRAFARLFEY